MVGPGRPGSAGAEIGKHRFAGVLMMETTNRVVFAGSRAYTLGAELEFQILDSNTLDLVPRAPALLARIPPELSEKVTPEFIRSIVEIQTEICDSVEEVGRDLRQTIGLVQDIASEQGCLLYSASLHPFAEPADQILSLGERYRRIMDELQLVGRQFISQGLHVHVGVADQETAIRVCDVMQVYLPIFLALSCSSPFFRGEDTGLDSYRTKLFEALPLAGIAGYLGSWQAYVDEIAMLQKSGVIRQPKDLWWDIRPSPGYGTVEIRVCDLPARFAEVLGLVALLQALVAAISEECVKSAPVSPQLLCANKWQAARHGLAGRFCDPLGLLRSSEQSMGQAVRELMMRLDPWLTRFGGQGMEAVEQLVEQGNSATRQRRYLRRYGTLPAMIQAMREVYWSESEA